MPGDFSEVLRNVNPADLKIDSAGRLIIDNAEVAKSVSEAMGGLKASSEAEGNGICCGNTSCSSPELMDLLNRVVRGGRPG